MNLNQYIQKIDRYLSKDEGLPIIVDVQNNEEQNKLVQHYNVGNNELIHASQYCIHDEMPHFDTLLNDLATKETVMIVTGVTSYLKLYGEQELKRFMQKLLSLYIKGHVIFISFQCKEYLPVSDTRIGRRIIVLEGENQKTPDIIFVSPDIPVPQRNKSVNGIEHFAAVAELSPSETIYIITDKSTESFPKTLFRLSELKNTYNALIIKDSETKMLSESIGTDAQWNYALKLFDNSSGWTDVIDKVFGNHRKLEHIFPRYKSLSENEKWLYFIALKLYGAKNNWCLTTAAKNADNINAFIRHIYRGILEKSVDEKDFWECYASRKTVLRELGDSGAELTAYCKIVFSKGMNAVCYLTDNTQREQETILSFLDQYGLDLDRNKLMKIISRVYPDLYNYLLPYRFGNDLLDQYFQEYKYQKAINKIFPEFLSRVEEQAEKRDYNYLLQPRSSVIESLKRDDSQLYFMDAMGVEYLSFILSVCRELDLMTNITVCTAELPSITSKNKDFIAMFDDSLHPTISIKDIDEIKHHGKYNYDYYKYSRLPIHLIKELEVIRNVLEKIRNDLIEGNIKHAFMIADHGASRLAVLYDTENVWEMSEKGQHSGRCCPKSDVDEKPVFAADAGDFWALANYDRFRGGRKANVEVHGGATLEELCVPVIELTYSNAKPEIVLMPINKTEAGINDIPIIEVSFRKKAALKVFSSVSLQKIGIVINGVFYPAVELGNNYYRVDMPDIKKAGEYYADVYSGDNLIAEKLPFVIRKEGQQERNLL